MVTIGLAKELYFIASVSGKEVFADVYFDNEHSLELKVSPHGMLDAHCNTHHIWHESVEGEDSFFGIESCDAISRIVACINNGTPWQHLAYHEKP